MLLVRANPQAAGLEPVVQVTPERAGWIYIGFEVYRLRPGDTLDVDGSGREVCAIVLEGVCDVRAGDERFTEIGGRDSVFDPVPPEAVYCPPGHSLRVEAQTRAEVAVAAAPADRGASGPRCIRRADIPYEHRGAGQTERFIHHILDEHHPAEKLLLVEVVTPAGNWSSFPPHKHDEDVPGRETYLEETYYYRIDPPHGRALQRVYDKQGLDEVLAPGDRDLVLVPRGYHPVAAIPGFRAYYLNVMAGHQRAWKYQLDPDYAHVAPKDGNIMGRVERAPDRG
ncbi:MAG: 5-deoxy-glucuronate isomerase [Alicyclobacillus macrosporangiidus]|uniref:5-deoxy-glucuronate isomerase n=1 Tax=Alicyclobacillus macrosporangiidus TaxID=392015 RepID=UPI0026ECF683|nr:5-deoxy-glucuronate isomerase [Alicyclobacillus macrosporangiidus]MCL6600912.1 5-deoxy-glucuronate isomerase [Alicyclobacillus macrosporangiidus]